MNRKMLPIMFMLIAGVITCIATWIHGYSVLEKLVILLVVLLIFGTLGSLLQYTMNCFDKQNQKKKEDNCTFGLAVAPVFGAQVSAQ